MHKFCVLILCLCAIAATAQPDVPDAWDRVLTQAGLTKETCHFDLLDMASYGGDEFHLAFFDAMHRDPLRIPFYARILRSQALNATPSCGEMATLAAGKTDDGTRRNLLGEPNAESAKKAEAPNALEAAIKAVCEAGGKPVPAERLKVLRTGIGSVPKDVANAAAFLLYSELQSLDWRKRALARFTPQELGQFFKKLVGIIPDSDNVLDPDMDRLMHGVDLKYLLAGGIDLAFAVDKATTLLANRKGLEKFQFQWETPLGQVALSGVQSDSYDSTSAYLLTIDTGGDDRYVGGAGTEDAAHPVSVSIDLAGNDTYAERAEMSSDAISRIERRKTDFGRRCFGSGVMGYGILVDVKGNDVYRSFRNTQGRGLFGLGILQDRAGDDRYDCYMTGQGAGTFGVGVLADLDGRDEYRCFTTSQGFGETRGCGLLVDAGAQKDLYEANDTVIDFPSPQTKEHNANLAQGVGFGRRADYLDGHSLAGGIGALVDGGGDNMFSGGLFCQGAGYWYGAGVLSAGDGMDTYRGVWYVQGSAAHFAVGILHDTGGNDVYQATMNVAQGAGHNFSVGFLMDDAGDDRHEAPNLSLGGGNANGFGFFWDKVGNDTYVVTPSTTLGRASIEGSGRGSIRERNITLGLFLDTGGRDAYPTGKPWAKDGAGWIMAQSGAPPIPAMRGAGLDTEAPGTPEPK